MLKEKNLDVPKVVEQIQQKHTIERTNKNNLLDRLVSDWDEIKEKTLQKNVDMKIGNKTER